MDDAERINYIILGLKTNKNRLGLSLGDKNGMRLQHVVSGRNRISEDLAADINRTYPKIPYEWILNGTGEAPMITPSDGSQSTKDQEFNAKAIRDYDDINELDLIKVIDNTEFRFLDDEQYLIVCPLINQYAYAGYVSGYADFEYVEELPKHKVIASELKLGAYRSFEVKGDSMDNGMKGCYSSGDIVTAKMLQRKHWDSQLQLRRANRWVVVTNDGIVIKEIVKHDLVRGVITLHSLNPMYEDYDIYLSNVNQLFYVQYNTEKRISSF